MTRFAIRSLVLFTIVATTLNCVGSEAFPQATWPDLSQSPPPSVGVEEGTGDLANLLQALHQRDVAKSELGSTVPEHPIDQEPLAELFEWRMEHQKSIRRASREKILELALGFQDKLATWICTELDENQRRWLFQQHLAQNGYQGLRCGWLVTALKIDKQTQQDMDAAVANAAASTKASKPRYPAAGTDQEKKQFAKEARKFYDDRRELVNELIWPLLNGEQQRFIRTAEQATQAE